MGRNITFRSADVETCDPAPHLRARGTIQASKITPTAKSRQQIAMLTTSGAFAFGLCTLATFLPNASVPSAKDRRRTACRRARNRHAVQDTN